MPNILDKFAGLFESKREPATPLKVAATSSILGAIVGGGIATAAFCWPTPGTATFGLHVASLGVFHLSEFMVTAKYNPRDLTLSSFLLTNGPEYAAAQLLAVTEAVLGMIFGQPFKKPAIFAQIGLGMVVIGQIIRTAAMIKASRSFSHLVASTKKDDHTLVTDGIYAWIRHPSYTGYFLWAVGTQVMMCNPVCTVLFSAVLFGFFKRRIKTEEAYLTQFFGQDYTKYRGKVWSGLPFVQ